MDVKQLRKLGGIVPSTPVTKQVTWADRKAEDGTALPDVPLTVHIKKLSFGAIERLFVADDKDPERSRMAAFISDTLTLDDEGKPQALTYQDAYQLDSGLARVLMDAIGAVNGTSGASAAKN